MIKFTTHNMYRFKKVTNIFNEFFIKIGRKLSENSNKIFNDKLFQVNNSVSFDNIKKKS